MLNSGFDTDDRLVLDQEADEFVNDLNPAEFAATVVGAGTLVTAVGLTTVAAPGFVVPPALAAGGLAILGYHKRHGHLPLMGKKDEAPVAAVQPVTDTKGNEVAVEGL